MQDMTGELIMVYFEKIVLRATAQTWSGSLRLRGQWFRRRPGAAKRAQSCSYVLGCGAFAISSYGLNAGIATIKQDTSHSYLMPI